MRAPALLVALVALLAGPLAAQEAPEPTLRAPLGETWCTLHGPRSQVITGHGAQVELEQSAHEAVHRRQLGGPACALALTAIKQYPVLEADVEAEAGCAQLAAAAPLEGLGWTFAMGALRSWLYARFPTLPHPLLDALLAYRCGAER